MDENLYGTFQDKNFHFTPYTLLLFEFLHQSMYFSLD